MANIEKHAFLSSRMVVKLSGEKSSLNHISRIIIKDFLVLQVQFSLDENINFDIPQVSCEENEKLTSSFTEQEVKEAIFQMKHNKAPRPDGFPAEFYQIFWETIKGDLMALFKDFYEGNLPLFSLNFGIITLLPKQEDATHIPQFRPICLLNVSLKIFTKVAVNRMTGIANKLVSRSQTAFLPGRNILEGGVVT
jgi:hypothetical protein